ncbi:MAG: hypothetical protein NZO16_03775 [Deltaproteobacteria bacterium]|nr:hypothetical protein [Deltaproteobacteria bacterium]
MFERFKKIKTDSTPLGKPISLKESIVGKYLQLFDSPENFNSLVVEALEGRLGWGDLKSLAYEKFLSYFARQRLVYNEISKDSEHLEKILRIGAEKASAVAVDTVSSVIQKFNPVTLC